VTDLTRIEEQFRMANPIPDPANPPLRASTAAAALLDLERRGTMDTKETRVPTGVATPRRRRSPALVAAAAFAAVIMIGVVTVLVNSGGGETAPVGGSADPATVIQDYINAYNAGDLDAVMALFTEESTITGHPFHPVGGTSKGLVSIRALHESDRFAAATVNPYTISNVEVSGSTVTWDHVWTNRNGENWCAEGHQAVIEDGRIMSWAFAPNPRICS
jgi:hypothetical protein